MGLKTQSTSFFAIEVEDDMISVDKCGSTDY